MDTSSPSDKQWLTLFTLIAHEQDMLTSIGKGPNGKIKLAEKWSKVADELNKLSGAHKTGEKWKEAFNGLKSRARKAYRAKTNYVGGTGGGPPPAVKGLGLWEVHERLLDLVGITAAVGNPVLDPLQAQLQAAEEGQADPVRDQALHNVRAATAASKVVPAAAAGQAAGAATGDQATPSTSTFTGDTVYYVKDDGTLSPLTVKTHYSPSFGSLNFASTSGLNNQLPLLEPDPDLERALKESMQEVKTNILAKHKIKDEWDDTTIELSDQSNVSAGVIYLGDTPEKKVLHTPPKGSGLTPSRKRLSYPAPPQPEPAMQSSNSQDSLAAQLKLTRDAMLANTQAVLLLTAALSKMTP